MALVIGATIQAQSQSLIYSRATAFLAWFESAAPACWVNASAIQIMCEILNQEDQPEGLREWVDEIIEVGYAYQDSACGER
jgi:hypothetical protein